MRSPLEDLSSALRLGGGALRGSEHPELAWTIRRAERDGLVLRPFPGIVTATDPSWQARVRAAWLWRPDAVFTGSASAALSWWPQAPVDAVALRVPRSRTAEAPGFGLMLGQALPAELVHCMGNTWMTTPDVSAIDAALHGETALLYRGLRKNQFTPAQLREAAELARKDSWRRLASKMRNNPWSDAELDLHELLRAGGISGWVGNKPIELDGRVLIGDVLFERAHLVIEVDSWSFHQTREQIEHDWQRNNWFVAAGYRVIHLAPRRIRREPKAVLSELANMLGTRNMRSNRSRALWERPSA